MKKFAILGLIIGLLVGVNVVHAEDVEVVYAEIEEETAVAESAADLDEIAVEAISTNEQALILELLEMIMELQRKIQAIIEQLNNQTPPSPPKPVPPKPYPYPHPCPVFEHDLQIGHTDATSEGEVSELQTFLKEEGTFDIEPTGYYGPITDQAVNKLREKRGVSVKEDFAIWCPPLHRGLRVISPNGGETWELGDKVEIRWSNSNSGNKRLPFTRLEQETSSIELDAMEADGSDAGYGDADQMEDGPMIMEDEMEETDALMMEDSVRITIEERYQCPSGADACIDLYSTNHTIVWHTPNDGRYTWRVGDVLNNDKGLYEGLYRVTVEDMASGRRDSSDGWFKIVGDGYGRNHPPTIEEVAGPTRLDVWERGKWEIVARDRDNDNLRYRVDWGEHEDEFAGDMATDAAMMETFSQTTTFTHRYSKAGTYRVVFTVTDSHGESAESSMTVRVGHNVCQDIPEPPSNDDPYCGFSPNYDGSGCIVSYLEWCEGDAEIPPDDDWDV